MKTYRAKWVTNPRSWVKGETYYLRFVDPNGSSWTVRYTHGGKTSEVYLNKRSGTDGLPDAGELRAGPTTYATLSEGRNSETD